jgi:predicted nuclease of predicted toxin-antitoxin system
VKLKLDENLSRHAANLIRAAGHDAVTVSNQGLSGAADETLFEVCKREGRTLITLDRDFGQVLRYPPAGSAGIVVLEIGHRVTHSALLERIRELLCVLKTQSPVGASWIIEPGRLRIHLPSDGDAQ